MSSVEKPQSLGDVVIFNTEAGAVNVQLDLVDETVWVNQSGIAELFSTSKQVVSYHLGNIFKEGELVQNSVVKEILTTAEDNKRYKVKFYNLDAVIAVGYRVNSKRATAFRIWATKVLRDYLIKGFALDDNRFKKGQSLTHFKELIDRIREIRLSEKVFSEYKEKQRHLEKIESLKELERDLSEYRKRSNSI